MILLTAMPASRQPGAVPTVPVAQCLASYLLDRGKRVRVLAPASAAAGWPVGVEVHVGSVTDPEQFAAAVSGVDRVFMAGLVGEPLAQLRVLANAIVTNEVCRVVMLGSHGSDFEDEISDETWQWSAFERSLDRKGISWAWLRPTAVMAHTLTGGYPIPGSAMVDTIRQGREIHEYLPDAPYAFIHEDDLAEIAAVLLLDGSHLGSVDVSGTTVSATERITAVTEALGIHASVATMSPEQAADTWRCEGWPEDTIEVMLYALPAFTAQPDNPALRAQEEAARTLLGRAPRTFGYWADQLRGSRTSSAHWAQAPSTATGPSETSARLTPSSHDCAAWQQGNRS